MSEQSAVAELQRPDPAGTEVDTPELVRAALRAHDVKALGEALDAASPAEMCRTMAVLSPQERIDVFDALTASAAADVIDDLPDEQSADLLEELDTDRAAAIVGELDSDDQADVLSEMGHADAAAILGAMSEEDARQVRELMSYPADTAGGVMIKEFISYPAHMTVEEVLNDLRLNAPEYAHYDVQYFYVVDTVGVLRGVLRLRDVVLSPENRPVEQIMIRQPTVVRDDATIHDLQRLFEVHSYVALPVVNSHGQLLGVVTQKDVSEAVRKNASQTMLKLAGIFGGEELRSMSLRERARSRLSWLTVNLLLDLVAVSVIAMHEHTLSKLIALAVLLPIVSDMSGNTGIQAIALSLRELTLGLIRPRDLLYVLGKEFWLSILNGSVLGVLVGCVSFLWKRDPRIGLVIGTGMALNTIVAGCVGGLLPLVIKRLRLDPAIASGPILTTITDMCGFFLVLSLAAWSLQMWPL